MAEVVVALSNGSGGAGTATDGLIFCKNGTPPGAATCQFWNGTSFTEVADLSVNRYANAGGGANSTNAISVGGYNPLQRLQLQKNGRQEIFKLRQ